MWGLSFVCARARARLVVAGIRLSRIRAFLLSVQRPTILSPARWITASKPDTASGDGGCSGFQGIRSSLLVPRAVEGLARRAIRAPAPVRERISADPTRPDEPLTRMRANDRFPTVFNLADSVAGMVSVV